MQFTPAVTAAIAATFTLHFAQAQSLHAKVAASANIYGAGQMSPPGGGTLPPSVALPAGTQCISFVRVDGTLPCAAKAGCITLDKNELEGTHLNDPDGIGGYPPSSSNTGFGSISGIQAPFAGYLVGVFTPAGGPSGPAPRLRKFLDSGKDFLHLAPELDQTFFIGDGLVRDGTGKRQVFSVPAGATALYLGISDTCMNWNGAPGCYYDNVGSFRVVLKATSQSCLVPTKEEP